MAFLLGTCRYDLGNARDTIAAMDRIVFLCSYGQVQEARAMADETKPHIAASPDLLCRPYITARFQEIMGIVDRAEGAMESP